MSAVTFYLKKPDNSRFGPVLLSELKNWARMGRVGPADQISADKVRWLPANEMEALQMNCWILHRSGHEYGPIHPYHLAQLMLAGKILPDEPAKQTDDAEPSTALYIALRALMTGPSSSFPEPDEDQGAAQHAQAMRDRLDEVQFQLKTALDEKAKQENELRTLQERAKELEQQQKEWETLREQLERELEKHNTRLDEALARNEETESARQSLEQQLKQRVDQLAEANTRCKELQHTREQLERELEKHNTRLDEALARKKETESARQSLEQELGQSKVQLAEANTHYKKLDSTRKKLERELKQLNARLNKTINRNEKLESARKNHGRAIKDFETRLNEATHQNDSLKSSLNQVENELKQHAERLDVAHARNKELEAKHEQLEQELKQNKTRLNESDAQRKDAQTHIDDLTARVEAARTETEQLISDKHALQDCEKECDQLRKELDELRVLFEKEQKKHERCMAELVAENKELAHHLKEAEVCADEAQQYAESLKNQLGQAEQQRPKGKAAEGLSPLAHADKLNETNIRLKVAISEKQRLETELQKLTQRLRQYEKRGA